MTQKLLKAQPDGWWGEDEEEELYHITDLGHGHEWKVWIGGQKFEWKVWIGSQKIEESVTWDSTTYTTYGDLKKGDK